MGTTRIKVPRYYDPWPHQQAAWQRRQSGKYRYYFKLWARQTGKDTDDIQYCLKRAWDNPGSQSAYVGLDNVWITNNIFKKVIDGRKHWADYPSDIIRVHDTFKEVSFRNETDDMADARIKFIGFLNDDQLIGSSYDNFYISEGSLYKENAFGYLQPIWDQKVAQGKELSVNFNGTPRGIKNVLYELMRTYSGVDDPEDFPGAHGDCYIDKVTIHDVQVPFGVDKGGRLLYRPLYTEEGIERLKDRYLRQFGNLNLYKQEYECEFTTVNAGLVYQGIEKLVEEKRFTPYNIDTTKPVYAAFDISSKEKTTDATAGIVFQYYNGKMFVYDIFEDRGKSFVECFTQLAAKPYFNLIRFVALPWDSERSASSETPLEEAKRMYPNINWHALSKERVDRGIDQVRRMLPNMIINSVNCDWLLTCFMNYEYKRLEKMDDWAAKPKHDRHSHLMDAIRYSVMAINEMSYLHLNNTGADPQLDPYYAGFSDDEDDDPQAGIPLAFRKKVKNRDRNIYL